MDKRSLLLQLSRPDRLRLYARALSRMVSPLAGSHALAASLPLLAYSVRPAFGWGGFEIAGFEAFLGLALLPALIMVLTLRASAVYIHEMEGYAPGWPSLTLGFSGSAAFCALLLSSTVPHSAAEIAALRGLASISHDRASAPAKDPAPAALAVLARAQHEKNLEQAMADNSLSFIKCFDFPLFLGAPLAFLLGFLGRRIALPTPMTQAGPKPALTTLLWACLSLPAKALLAASAWPAILARRSMEALAEKSILDDREWAEAEGRAIALQAAKPGAPKPSPHQRL